MKVGDYVRTKYGIGKLMIIEDNSRIFIDRQGSAMSLPLNENEDIKIDSEPINLIEIGDYVNGHRVNYINKDRKHFNISFGNEDFTLNSKFNGDTYWLSKEDIKSIVTKEQFECLEYTIK